MAFQITPNVFVTRDSNGIVRQLGHLQQPYFAASLAGGNPRALARTYLGEVASIYSVDSSLLPTLDHPIGDGITQDGLQLRFGDQSSLLETTLVSYSQTRWSLPIWEAGLGITILAGPQRITSSRSTIHVNPSFHEPSRKPKFLPKEINERVLRTQLGIGDRKIKINGTRLRVYQYDPSKRYDPESSTRPPTPQRRKLQHPKSEPKLTSQSLLRDGPPILPLPAVPSAIEPGTHYAVTEVLFTLAPARGTGKGLNWRVFLEVDSGAPLYLRAFVAGSFANVFTQDPITLTGDTTKTACSGDAVLDLLTTSIVVPRLTVANPQGLTGQYVQLEDVNPPNVTPPIVGNPPGDFTGVVSGNTFAATNAYYHVDFLYNLMQQFGFDVPSYHSGTTFPVPVDQSDQSNGNPNAFCAGNAFGTGTGEFGFGTVDTCATSPGMAASFRVVMHEFCHNLLWNRVHAPNFGFSHSAGDSIAAILSDPGSQAPDRFLTFPWVPIVVDRRHDRDVASGWAWGGVNDVGGYSSEQILSTTHFRIYRSMGGDDPDVNVQIAAAQKIVFLIMKAIASLGPSPIIPTPTPNPWETALENSDTSTTSFEGVPGGTAHKVIRWGFEQQGLFQPAGAPTPVTTPGAPPDVDVYVDDGRSGQYPYQPVFWENTDIWNRLAPDGGTTHQTPIVNVTNYGYVRIKNRGTQTANNVVVSGFHCRPSAGLTWPDDWQAMTTAFINVPGSIASGAQTIVGPFEWIPSEIGHECMLMSASADGDLSNIDPAGALPCATGPTPDEQLARFDNNIGQRNVAPVAGGGGLTGLLGSFVNRHFWTNNPYNKEARINLEVTLPLFLAQRGWQVAFLNPGGGSFTLPARGSRKIHIVLKAGAEFTAADVMAAGKQAGIVVSAKINGYIFGGITYQLDPNLKSPPVEVLPGAGPHKGCTETAHHLLECLKLPCGEVKSVCVKKVTIDIELKNCDC
jgi:zinc metalloprotease ZmpB